jgi:short-subunit dehydrogenase
VSSAQPRRVGLVTGASGGIGSDIARVLARRGHDLALVARRRDKLEALADEIETLGRPRPLVIALDLGAPDAAATLADELAGAGASVDILVNNAGFGLAGDVASLDAAEQLAVIDLNVGALVAVTLRLLPDLIACRGRILNVASTAAFLPGPGMAVYYATKAFVLSFSEALTQELRRQGVTVSVLCPGPTATGFVDRAGLDSADLFKRFPQMSSMQVAEAGVAGLMAGRRVILPGLMNKLTGWLVPLVPHALVLPVVAHLQAVRRHD